MTKTILLALCAFTAQAATVTLNYSSAVTPGSSFDVTVQVSGVFTGLNSSDALLAYGFNVNVGNAAVIVFTGSTAGALFTDTSGQFGGVPQVAGVATNFGLSAGDFTQPLTLATLHFLTLSGGTTTLGVSTSANDLNQGLTYFLAATQPISASGTVQAVGGVPEPGTLMLSAGAALALLAAAWRRRNPA